MKLLKIQIIEKKMFEKQKTMHTCVLGIFHIADKVLVVGVLDLKKR